MKIKDSLIMSQNCEDSIIRAINMSLFCASAGLLSASDYACSHSETTSGFFKEFSPLVTIQSFMTQHSPGVV